MPTLVWQDLENGFSSVVDVVADGQSIVVAGAQDEVKGFAASTIRAYDSATGVLAWVDRADAGDGRLVGYRRLAVDDTGLFAGGSTFNTRAR